MKHTFRQWIFRIWYWYISKIDKNAEVKFMNYGYHDPDMQLPLEEEDEINRYPIQLYHRLAGAVDLKGKNIVEIGSGRGGGLAYLTKKHSPLTALGIDLDSRAVQFANKFYNLPQLGFRQGDAQSLPLDDQSFDIVLNVESSHRYPDMKRFLSEVNRILKPQGYFLITDFRYPYEMPDLEKMFQSLGFKQIEKQQINRNVLMALDKDTPRRIELVKKLAPFFLHQVAFDFAGIAGSETNKQIADEKYIYFLYVFQKNTN